MKKLFTLFFVLSLACSAFAGRYYYDGTVEVLHNNRHQHPFAGRYYYDGTLVYWLTSGVTGRYAYVCNPRVYPGSTPITPYTGNIVIPDSISTSEEGIDAYEVRYIDQGAFKNSTITSITLPKFVQSINDSAFYACRNLTSVTMKNGSTGIRNIYEFAFYKCDKMTNCSLTFDDIAGGFIFKKAFRYCEALTSINLNNVVFLGEGVFSDCTKLVRVTNLNHANITTLPKMLFYNCSSLKSIDIPGNVRSIGDYAFENCRSLKEVDLDTCTADINATMFKTCDSLETFYVSYKNKRYSGGYGLIDKTTKTLVVGSTNGNLGDKIINSNDYPIETIGDSAYYGRNITEIILPLTLRSINKRAFANTKLKNIYIPNTVQNIGRYAFYNTPLEKIILGENINTIGFCAFDNCSNLTSIVATSINPCDVSFTADNQANITVEVDSPYINTYKADPYWKNMNIVESDEYDNGFFYYLDNNEATITTIDTIYNKCYYSLFQNDTIVIPEYVSYQGVNYPVSKIGYKAFYNTYPLSKNQQKVIKLPSSLKEIDDEAFYNSNLNNVIFNDGLETIGKLAFSFAHLKVLNLPTSVTEIGEGAFAGNLFTSVSIPNNVTTIKKSTFALCSNLERIDIGKKVTNIEKDAFTYSPNIRTIICKNVTPAVFESTTFTDNFNEIIKDSARLVVPEVALTDYQNAPVWQEFLDIQGKTELNPTAVEEAVIENLWVENGTVHYDGEFRIYDVVGRDVTNLNGNLNGIYIIRTDKAVQKVSITK